MNNKGNKETPRFGNNKKGPGRKHVQGKRKAPKS
jgi:hypothetical protein